MRTPLFLLAVMAWAALSCGAAASAVQTPDGSEFPAMRFLVVRSDDKACEPACPEWISAEGAIEKGTPAALKRVLKTLGGRRLPLVVHSPGGEVMAAMQLGRMIRAAKLDVAVGKTIFSGCRPDAKDCKPDARKGARFVGHPYAFNAMCNSACPLLLAGGVRRLAGLSAFVGVHQITTVYTKQKLTIRTTYRMVKGKKKILSEKVVGRKNAGSYKTFEMSRSLEKRIAAYLAEMGVERGVLDLAKGTPASSIHGMAVWDMFEMKLVTGYSDVSLVTLPAICKRVPAPDNCRLFTVSDLKE